MLPKKSCKDKKCPFHSSLKVRGRQLKGTVIATRMQHSATIEFGRRILLQKYERYTKKRSRIKVHNPECLNAEEGSVVKIMECRPISKTINFVIVSIEGKEKGFATKQEALEEGKKREKVVEETDASNKSTSD